MGKQLFAVGVIVILCVICLISIISENVTAEGFINIYSPSGGEYYYGEMLSISWESMDIGDYVKIELYKDESRYDTIDNNADNNGYFSYYISDSYPPSQFYRVKITSLSDDTVYDYSNNFAIYDNYLPSDGNFITITRPSRGEIWYTGDTYTITWNSENAGDFVKIGYEVDYSSYEITPNTINDGRYKWTIEISSGQYCRIYVTSISDLNISGYSEYFTIAERQTFVYSPSYGEKWFNDEMYTIDWDFENAGDYVSIELFWEGMFCSTITSNTNNDGTYSWAIPSTIPKNHMYQIKISSVLYSYVYSFSGYFSIDDRAVDIDFPSGGEIWYIGEEYPITWRSDNVGDIVNVDLYENGEYHFTIASDVRNNGYFLWEIPDDIDPGSQYSIKIASADYNSAYDYSNGYVSIEDQSIQKWLGMVFIIFIIVTALIVITVFIKIRREKKPKKIKPNKNKSEPLEVKREIKPEKISQKEYEQIWEAR